LIGINPYLKAGELVNASDSCRNDPENLHVRRLSSRRWELVSSFSACIMSDFYVALG